GLDEHVAARVHRVRSAPGRFAGSLAREAPSPPRAREQTEIRASVPIRLEIDLLPIQHAAYADSEIRHAAAAFPLEHEIRVDVQRHQALRDGVLDRSACGRPAETA